jgi:5-methylcytosine-specific restriction endonuclease McrA
MFTENWQKIRMRVLVRDDFSCQAHQLRLCVKPCDETKLDHLHVHHIRERQHGGSDSLDNLITLCHEHHIQIHPWMRRIMPLARPEAEYPVREL